MLFVTIGQGAIFLWMTAAGAVASAVLIAALIIGNYGRVRFYELFAAALGLAMFRFAAASPAHAAMKKLAALLKAAGKRLNSYKVIKYLLK